MNSVRKSNSSDGGKQADQLQSILNTMLQRYENNNMLQTQSKHLGNHISHCCQEKEPPKQAIKTNPTIWSCDEYSSTVLTTQHNELMLRRQLLEQQKSNRKIKTCRPYVTIENKRLKRSSNDDTALIQIEKILERSNNEILTQNTTACENEPDNKQPRIISKHVLVPHEESTRNPDICDMSKSTHQNETIKHSILNSSQIALTLVHENFTTQMADTECLKVVGLLILPTSIQISQCRMSYFIRFTGTNNEWMLWTRDFLKDVLLSKNIGKICYNGQEIFRELLQNKLIEPSDAIKYQLLDVKVGVWLLDADNVPVNFKEICNKFQIDFNTSKYGMNDDLKILHRVMGYLSQKLHDNNLWDVFAKVEMPLCPILAVMELEGLQVDRDVMCHNSEIIKRKLKCLELEAHKAAGRVFLLNSHSQLRQVIFEELQLDKMLNKSTKIARTTVNKEKSTSESVLYQLRELHPLPAIVLEYRQLQKLKSTYIDGLMQYVRSDGLLQTMWEQTSAATGRLTSARPNIQSIPKQSVLVSDVDDKNTGSGDVIEGYQVYAREAFISRTGWSFLAADFQQIELRLLAHLSSDESLIDIFNCAVHSDIFIELSSKWLKKPENEVTKSDREQTKRIVYSVMYGIGKERLSDYLKTSPENAKRVMSRFLDTFPGIGIFTKRCISQCKAKGFVSTIFRRRRLIPNIDSGSYFVRSQAERQAVNFCVQGSAADLCKAAMIQVAHKLIHRSPRSRLLVQIHDELLFEVPDEEIQLVKGIIREVMENSEGLCGGKVHLTVPIKVAITVGKNWAQMN